MTMIIHTNGASPALVINAGPQRSQRLESSAEIHTVPEQHYAQLENLVNLQQKQKINGIFYLVDAEQFQHLQQILKDTYGTP